MRRKHWVWSLSVLLATAGYSAPRPAGKSVPATSPATPVTAILAPPAFRPTGVWFIDEAEGWVIGDGCAAGGACVSQTRDGGRHWEATGAWAAAEIDSWDDITRPASGDGPLETLAEAAALRPAGLPRPRRRRFSIRQPQSA